MSKKNCLYCSKVISHRNNKFCNRTCSGKYRTLILEPKEIIYDSNCLHCSKPISSIKKFCSHKCSNKYNFSKEIKKLPPEKICPVCNKLFNSYDKKYCSKECFNVYWNKSHKINCKKCGKEFDSYQDAVYCSVECKNSKYLTNHSYFSDQDDEKNYWLGFLYSCSVIKSFNQIYISNTKDRIEKFCNALKISFITYKTYGDEYYGIIWSTGMVLDLVELGLGENPYEFKEPGIIYMDKFIEGFIYGSIGDDYKELEDGSKRLMVQSLGVARVIAGGVVGECYMKDLKWCVIWV